MFPLLIVYFRKVIITLHHVLRYSSLYLISQLAILCLFLLCSQVHCALYEVPPLLRLLMLSRDRPPRQSRSSLRNFRLHYWPLSVSSELLSSSDELKISLFETVDVSSSDSFRILLGLNISSLDSSSRATVDMSSVTVATQAREFETMTICLRHSALSKVRGSKDEDIFYRQL